jgi:hypothetical protein
LFLLPLRSTSHLRVLRYLHGTNTRRLFFPRSSSLQFQAYYDATWASDPSDNRSLSAYCVFLDGSLIAWKTKKLVSHSSAEAELRAMTLVTAEVTCYNGCLRILILLFLCRLLFYLTVHGLSVLLVIQ